MLAAEIIREVALGQLEHEVPHALNVEVIEWSRRKSGVIYVEANITVERDSQKGIVIGSKGQMLKRIGADARRQIERELGIRVYLELYVKVRGRWRDDDAWLRRYGYKPE
jgi:GTP-binding protein Era